MPEQNFDPIPLPAGLRLDTSAADDPRGGKGPRWRPLRKSDRGFAARSPVGF